MSYEHLRGVMGGTPHTTTGSTMLGVTARPHLSLVPVPDAVEVFDPEPVTTDQWQDRALCAQTDPEAFFPEKGGSTREAKKICLGCEVRSGMPRLRLSSRRAVRHLGRALRAGTPPPQARNYLTRLVGGRPAALGYAELAIARTAHSSSIVGSMTEGSTSK